MTKLDGKTAVITGAGSGIGRALAYELARKGTSLALSDVDRIGLAETVRHARVIGARVHEQRLDVTDRDAVLAYADTVAAEFGAVHVVINNAGVAFSGDVEEMEFDQIERIMNVDFWGVVHGTKAFLPYLIESGDGHDTSHIVNISSLFGLLAMPSQSAYNAAKFAVRGFTESLRQELLIAKRPVQVSCVHPGGIKTGIARNGGAVAGKDAAQIAEFFDSKLAKTTAEAAARTIVKGIEGNKPRVLIGNDAKVLHLLIKVLGARYEDLFARLASRVMPKAAPVESAATLDAAARNAQAKVSA